MSWLAKICFGIGVILSLQAPITLQANGRYDLYQPCSPCPRNSCSNYECPSCECCSVYDCTTMPKSPPGCPSCIYDCTCAPNCPNSCQSNCPCMPNSCQSNCPCMPSPCQGDCPCIGPFSCECPCPSYGRSPECYPPLPEQFQVPNRPVCQRPEQPYFPEQPAGFCPCNPCPPPPCEYSFAPNYYSPPGNYPYMPAYERAPIDSPYPPNYRPAPYWQRPPYDPTAYSSAPMEQPYWQKAPYYPPEHRWMPNEARRPNYPNMYADQEYVDEDYYEDTRPIYAFPSYPTEYGSCQPSCNLCDLCQWRYALRGEFLYWCVNQTNLDYAIENPGDGLATVVGKTRFLKYGYQPGFRIALITTPPCCDWEIRGVYTHLYTKAKGSVRAPADGTLNIPLSHPASGVTNATFAIGHNRLNYDVADALAYGKCCCGNCLLVRPFGGFRFLHMDQDMRVEYSGTGVTGDPDIIRFESDFKGVGLRGGAETEFTLCGGLKTYAGFGGSVLVARNKTHQREFLQDSADTPVVHLHQSQKTALLGFDVRAGFGYECCLCGCMAISAAIGYEFQEWLDTPQMRRFYDGIAATGGTSNIAASGPDTAGHISFHGLVARLQIGF